MSSKPATAEPDTDWLIEIFDGRFVGVRYGAREGAMTIFGDLREQGLRPRSGSGQDLRCPHA
jgi:hypothetical protein